MKYPPDDIVNQMMTGEEEMETEEEMEARIIKEEEEGNNVYGE